MKMNAKTIKRISRWMGVICALVLALAMGITAFATASEGDTVYVKGDSTNIRSEASTDSSVVGQLNANAPLTVTGVTSAGDGHNWYQVTCVIGGETKTGYIREDLVEFPDNGGGDEGGETADPEMPDDGMPAEGTGEEAPSSGLSGVSLLTPLESEEELLNVPAGFHALTININGMEIPAWADASNEYYIFYAMSPAGNIGWYLYDKMEAGYVRYSDFMGAAAAAAGSTVSSNGDGVSKTAFIIVIVICVLLVAATTVMGIKLMNGGGRDDYDDYDDDDDYDDEEEDERPRKSSVFKKFSRMDEEEDYEDEDDDDDERYDEDDYEERRRQPVRQSHQVVVQREARTARPVGEGRQVSEGRPAGRPAGESRPVSTQRPAGGEGRPVSQSRPAGAQRPAGSAPQGQQRYVQRQSSGQQRYAQRPVTRRSDDEY